MTFVLHTFNPTAFLFLVVVDCLNRLSTQNYSMLILPAAMVAVVTYAHSKGMFKNPEQYGPKVMRALAHAGIVVHYWNQYKNPSPPEKEIVAIISVDSLFTATLFVTLPLSFLEFLLTRVAVLIIFYDKICNDKSCGVCVVAGIGLVYLHRVSILSAFDAAQKQESYLADLRVREAALEEIPKGIVIADAQQLILHVNKAFCEITGYSAEDMVNKQLSFAMELLSRNNSATSTLPNEGHFKGEVAHCKKDGTPFWNDMTICAVRSQDKGSNNVALYIATVDDISERVQNRLNKERWKQDDVLLDIFKNMPGTITFEVSHPGTAQKTHAWVAGQTEKVLGYDHDEWMSMDDPFLELLTLEGQAKLAAIINEDLRRCNPPRFVEVGFLHKNGSPVWCMVDRTSRLLASGSLLIVLHDITAVVNLREMTRQRNIERSHALRFKRGCAFLSHEIRNKLFPQTVVLGMIRDLVVETAPPDLDIRLAQIDSIVDANCVVTTILNRVLDIAKFDAGEYPVVKSWFPPVFPNLRVYGLACVTRNGKTGVDFDVSIGASVCDDVRIKTDKTILTQIIDNLVSNAAKYTAKGSVTVCVKMLDIAPASDGVSRKMFRVDVVDTGRGMNAKELETALQAFGQIRTADDQNEGTGLGLALTLAMAKNLSGSLTLLSDGKGCGLTATVLIPVECSNLVIELPEPTDPFHGLHQCSVYDGGVLYADDNRINRQVVQYICRKMDVSCICVDCGRDAIASIQSSLSAGAEVPDIVILDMEMPPVNGDVACRDIRTAGYRGFVALLSGNSYTSATEKKEVMAAGFDIILSKMGQPGVRSLLKAYKARRQTDS